MGLIFFVDWSVGGFCSTSKTPYITFTKSKLEFARHVRK